MANIQSAIKRMRESEKVSAGNKHHVSVRRTAKKKFVDAAEAGDDNAQALYQDAVSQIDKVASKGLIHKNKANRVKSRLAAKLAK